MAEIPVERKSNLSWLWLLLALLVIGLLLWWVLDDDDEAEVAAVAPAPGIEAGVDPAIDAGPVAVGVVSVAAILANPAAYVGRDDFTAEVDVPDVPTDRGFWIEEQGSRMFALIIDNPQEVPLDINGGQRLRITDGMIRNADALAELSGAPLDADTRRILEEQPVFLLVDETNIDILSGEGG